MTDIAAVQTSALLSRLKAADISGLGLVFFACHLRRFMKYF
jgi:hypothetical protein